MSLSTIAYEVKHCTKCPISYNTPVPGIGPKDAKLMVVGMNPGKEEILFGEPLVGRSGKLLNKILEEAGFTRQEVYLTNVVKCLTPKNREPTDVEIDQCNPYIIDEIGEINPKVIVTLGKIPLRVFVNYKNPYKLKPTFKLKDYLHKRIRLPLVSPTIQFVPTFHPSFLLRTGQTKYKSEVELFKLIREVYLAQSS
jgi:DNA polymerase